VSRSSDFDTVILAGGGSTRMGGADKPGLAVGGTPMLVSVAQAAAGAGTSRLIVVGPGRAGVVRDGLAALGHGRPGWLICVVEEPARSGPVAGLRRGLAEVGAPLLLLLAADLPFLTAAHLLELLTAGPSAAEAEPAPDRPSAADVAAGVVAADASGAPQWLVSCWRADSLRAALAGYAGTSLRGLLAPLNPVRIGLAPSGPASPWLDCDTPDDLSAARRAWLGRTVNAEADS
jgi:molybdenum cofactor guanylyltransferase